MTINYTQFVLSLIFVVIIIFPCVWALKKLSLFGKKNDAINIIDKKLVAPGIYIAVAKIIDRYYILGLSSGSVSLIKEITELDEVKKIRDIYNNEQSFDEVLSSTANTLNNTQEKSYFTNGHSNIKKHLDKLENMVIKKKKR